MVNYTYVSFSSSLIVFLFFSLLLHFENQITKRWRFRNIPSKVDYNSIINSHNEEIIELYIISSNDPDIDCKDICDLSYVYQHAHEKSIDLNELHNKGLYIFGWQSHSITHIDFLILDDTIIQSKVPNNELNQVFYHNNHNMLWCIAKHNNYRICREQYDLLKYRQPINTISTQLLLHYYLIMDNEITQIISNDFSLLFQEISLNLLTKLSTIIPINLFWHEIPNIHWNQLNNNQLNNINNNNLELINEYLINNNQSIIINSQLNQLITAKNLHFIWYYQSINEKIETLNNEISLKTLNISLNSNNNIYLVNSNHKNSIIAIKNTFCNHLKHSLNAYYNITIKVIEKNININTKIDNFDCFNDANKAILIINWLPHLYLKVYNNINKILLNINNNNIFIKPKNELIIQLNQLILLFNYINQYLINKNLKKLQFYTLKYINNSNNSNNNTINMIEDKFIVFQILQYILKLTEELIIDKSMQPIIQYPIDQQIAVYAPYWIPIIIPLLRNLKNLYI